MMSVYGLSSYLPDIMTFIIDLSSVWGETAYTALALIFPFSYGFLAASAAFATPSSTFIASIAGSGFYTVLAVLAYIRSGKSLREVTITGVSTTQILVEREVVINSTSPLKAMIRKDLKLATRNIGSAFVFAIPIFLVVMLFPMIQYWRDDAGLLRSMASLTAVEYANLFGGISLVSILMFDTQGASIHEGLPISSKLILKSKTTILFVPYVVSMIAIDLMILINDPITPLLLLIPIIQVPCGYIIGMTVGATVYRVRGGGRAVAVNVTADQAMGLLSAAVGALVGIVPLIGYGLTMLFTGSQVFSLASQGVLVLVLILVAWRFIPRVLKD